MTNVYLKFYTEPEIVEKAKSFLEKRLPELKEEGLHVLSRTSLAGEKVYSERVEGRFVKRDQVGTAHTDTYHLDGGASIRLKVEETETPKAEILSFYEDDSKENLDKFLSKLGAETISRDIKLS